MESNERDETTPNHSLAIGAILVLLILLAFGTLLYTRSGRESSETGDNPISRTDRLYYEMGMLRIPGISPPVDIVLRDLNDQRVKLSDLKGKIVFLNFWTTWCPACRVEMPAMERLHKQLKDKDFAMVAISMQESGAQVRRFFEDHKLTFTALLDSDGTVGSRFGVISIPTTYILNKEGGVIGKAVGAREWHSKESISLFEHLMGADPGASSKGSEMSPQG